MLISDVDLLLSDFSLDDTGNFNFFLSKTISNGRKSRIEKKLHFRSFTNYQKI